MSTSYIKLGLLKLAVNVNGNSSGGTSRTPNKDSFQLLDTSNNISIDGKNLTYMH